MLGVGVPVGTVVEVSVPATSANLGPGYDSFGLAVDLRDSLRLTVVDRQQEDFVSIEGEDADSLPRDERHLVARVVRRALAEFGMLPDLSFTLECVNRIPHSRGLGSSACAVVAGVSAAAALARSVGASCPDEADFLRIATEWEGHPDNAAPAVYGGATLSWMRRGMPRAVCLDVHPDLELVQLIPDFRLDTAIARTLIPELVPHVDAAANSARAGLLVHALARAPELLLDATVDLLHQEYRRPAMPETLELLDRLRAAGIASTVSGAGPTILAMGGRGLTGAVADVLGTESRFSLYEGRLAQSGVSATVTTVL